MEHKYFKLVHAQEENTDWFVVNWCLGNTCNYECSYCPAMLHNGSIRWPSIEVIKNFISKIVEQVAPRKVYIELTGGEVTLFKDFVEICKHCTAVGAKVGLISNGSRTIRWWKENKQYFDHVCLSFHPEFAKKEHYIEVVKELRLDVRTHVNIMMSPEKFDECLEIAHNIKDIGNISMALQPLIHDFGEVVYDYTPVQHDVFANQHTIITEHIKWEKGFNFYRGAMKLLFPDGTEKVSSAHRFISEKTNDWSKWKCYSGVEQIIIDLGGKIFRGWCREGGMIGHVSDPKFNLPTQPIICNKTMCHCNFDIMSTKEKQ